MAVRLIFLLISSPHMFTNFFRQSFSQKVVSFEKSKNKNKYCLIFAKIRENIWWADELFSKAYFRDLGVEAIAITAMDFHTDVLHNEQCWTFILLIFIYFLFSSFWQRFEKKYQQPISLGAIPALQYGNDQGFTSPMWKGYDESQNSVW